VLVIALGLGSAAAQQSKYLPHLSSRLIKEARFAELPAPISALVDSAIKHFDDDHEPQKSAQDLQKILAMKEFKKTRSLFRAWVYQWLALNYFALDSSLTLVEQNVNHSLKANVEISREYPDLKRLPVEVKDIYQTQWIVIEDEFRKKLRSVRVALGPISRLDFSYRMLENWDVVGGIGTPIKVEVVPEGDIAKSKFSAFDQLLLFTRIQWMRKTIERLSAGIYVGFNFVDSLKSGEKTNKYFSGGPILGYTFKSGWEIGGSFEVAQLAFGSGAHSDLSITAIEKKSLLLSHGIIELYIRKWF
jgi:hypothetical protein